jgi:hypothetical protein
MRINPNVVVSPITQEPQSSATPKGEGRARAADEGAAIVALSRPTSAVADAPSPAMASRLDRIRALLDAGEYPIDLDQLATRIVDDESLRGGSK